MDSSISSANQEKKILVVDDHESNILTLQGLLKEEGYGILTALNGPTALRIAEADKPDLVLLDIKMPEMDGFEVCQQLKANPHTAHIPVIFLTVLSQTSDIVKGLELGAADYVPKPFKTAELLARVRTHLQLKAIKDEITLANKRLADQNEQLALLNSTKDKLLSIISHDLRAPMGTLKEILDFIMSHYADLDHHKLHESLESIRDSIESSYTLVENLLYWARNQRGDILFEPGMHAIKKIVDESVKLMTASALSKNIKMGSVASTDSLAYFDANMISVVIRNLINNAIKFTKEGGEIMVSIDLDKKDPENTLLIEVSDNGNGIREEEINTIFKDGSSFTTYGTGLAKGSGLGLKLCHEFVTRNGGKIWAENHPGKGSSFKFTLSRRVIKPAI